MTTPAAVPIDWTEVQSIYGGDRELFLTLLRNFDNVAQFEDFIIDIFEAFKIRHWENLRIATYNLKALVL